MPKVYEISNEYAELLNSDMEPELIKDTLEGLEGEFCDKVNGLLCIVKNEQYFQQNAKEEKNKLTEKIRVSENKVKNIKRFISEMMRTMEKTSLKTGAHSLTVREGVMSVVITDASKIPTDFVDYETVIKPNKNLMHERFKLGEKIDGAKYERGDDSLIIK